MDIVILGYEIAKAEQSVDEYRAAYKRGAIPLSALTNYLRAISPMIVKWRSIQLIIETLGGVRILFTDGTNYFLRQALDSRRVYWYSIIDNRPVILSDTSAIERAYQHERKRHKK